jgi:hypothetical protein
MNWQEANQSYLMASLARVRAHLPGGAAGRDEPSVAGGDEFLAATEAAMPAPSALQRLCLLFELSPFERDLLLLCAGPELDSDFARLCAETRNDSGCTTPTFALALACLPGAHWSALTPAAPLRRWRMIEVGQGDSLTRSPLRVDERILHYLAGTQYLDERLDGLLRPVTEESMLPPSHLAIVERVLEAVAAAAVGALPLVALDGQDAAARRAIAVAACRRLDLQMYAMRAAEIPSQPSERGALARLWEREAALSAGALLLEVDETDSPSAVGTFAERLGGPLFVASRRPLALAPGRDVVRVCVEKPPTREQQELWGRRLTGQGAASNGLIPSLVSQFDLTAPMIQAACTEVLARVGSGVGPVELKRQLWDACRAQARPRLDDLAQHVETHAGWGDIVLPEMQHVMLREIVAHVRQRRTVFETWGFAARGGLGLGTSVVFAGSSGTGKTLAAEVIANALRLDLYRIDLSSVVSKYIGETEKNLRSIFDAAEYGGAILLFDEADALFGKRSEVKDSHDRYANIEVSFLLQQMEAYRGLAVLTTNMMSAFDNAFLRRVRFIVQFPFPSAEERARIWSRVFPRATPTDGLDVAKLARLNVAGGNIRNIALNAAFHAADAAEPVRMTHLLRAVVSEYGKLERPLTEAEVGDWVQDYAG